MTWKIVLIVGVLIAFIAPIIPTKNDPEPIHRGLDLKGGTHLVMRVNVGDATRLEVDQAMEAMKNQSAKNNLPAPTSRRVNDSTLLVVPPAGVSTADYEKIAKDYIPAFDMSRTPEGAMLFKMKPSALSALERDTIEHSV